MRIDGAEEHPVIRWSENETPDFKEIFPQHHLDHAPDRGTWSGDRASSAQASVSAHLPSDPQLTPPSPCGLSQVPFTLPGAALRRLRLLQTIQRLVQTVCTSALLGLVGRGRVEAETVHLTLADTAADRGPCSQQHSGAQPWKHVGIALPRPDPGHYIKGVK